MSKDLNAGRKLALCLSGEGAFHVEQQQVLSPQDTCGLARSRRTEDTSMAEAGREDQEVSLGRNI